MRFHTSAVRDAYAPDVATARELMVDRIAERMGKDPRNICRCGTYQRIREAIYAGAENV